MEGLQLLAAVETKSGPVITYEEFGAEIGVTDTPISSVRPLKGSTFLHTVIL